MPLLVVVSIVLAALKMGGAIALPWLWVLAPVWIPLALFLLFGAVMFVIAAIASIVAAILTQK